MKRIITLLLVLTMVLGLCACGGGESKSEGLQIGYSRINVTPDYTVRISGYAGTERNSEGLQSFVYVTCIAATEGDETVLLYTIDSSGVNEAKWEHWRTAVAATTGIPSNKIFFGLTHTHSAPITDAKPEYPNSSQYVGLLLESITQAAVKALADRAPATVETAKPKFDNMNYVRHYKMIDGSYAGSNFGDYSIGFEGHVYEPDNEMQLVKFDRGEDKKAVLMVNWQAHPDHSTELGFNYISADFVGEMRDELEKLSGMHVAYFTGAAGNLNPHSKIEAVNNGLGWREYGVKLGQLAYEALDQLQPLEGSGIATATEHVDVEIDHSWDHMLLQANEVYALWEATGSVYGETKALCNKYNFSSAYQSRAIRDRAGKGATESREVSTIKIGGLGIANASYEMFSKNGQYIKENSPFETTFIVVTNHGYIPSEDAFDYRCYEADCGMYAKGSGEKLAEAYVRLLKTLN